MSETSILTAKERAEQYKKEQQEQEEAAKKKAQPSEDWRSMIDNRVEEAMRQGLFDNLRGKGKPLNLARNPFVPEEQEMAFKLLADNGMAPAWIGKRNDVLKEIERWRAKLVDMLAVYEEASQQEAQWQRQLETWQQEISDLNKRIEVVNLEQPVVHLEIFKLLLAGELERAKRGDPGG